MSDDLLFSVEKHIGFVTLNRPQAFNALTLPMILALHNTLLKWEASSEIHAVVIQAVEGKAFCAGGDVRFLYEMGQLNPAQQLQFFEQEYALNQLIYDYPKPYIALMDGITMGGGVGISLHGSHSVASERFSFAMPETAIGFFPDIGSSHLLTRCPGYFGVYLGLTGNRIGANEALNLGLVKHVVDATDFNALRTLLMATDLSLNAHDAVTACIAEFHQENLQTGIMDELRSLVDASFCSDTMDAIIKNLTMGHLPWHKEMVQNLQKKSPLSLCITLSQLQKTRNMTLADCLSVDKCLVRHFMKGHDFYEGVRALLIDKDQSPLWRPNQLSLVTERMVAEYFDL